MDGLRICSESRRLQGTAPVMVVMMVMMMGRVAICDFERRRRVERESSCGQDGDVDDEEGVVRVEKETDSSTDSPRASEWLKSRKLLKPAFKGTSLRGIRVEVCE